MSTDHLGVIVPSFEVVNGFPVDFLESEGACVVVNTLLVGDFEVVVTDFLLAFNHANDETAHNVKRSLGVMPRSSNNAWFIDEIVATEEEL